MLTADPEVLVSPDRIEAIATQLAQIATGPLFLEQLACVREVAPPEKFHAARAAIDKIKHEIAPLPDGFRLTTRHFESPTEDQQPSAEIRDGVLTVVYDGGVIVVRDKADHDAGQPTGYDAERVREVIKAGIEDIGTFVATAPFKALLGELYALPLDRRPAFVEKVVLDVTERAERGLKETPPGLVIQRSEFADGRPTLFCVSKILPLAYPWHKVTITFDSEHDPAAEERSNPTTRPDLAAAAGA